MALPKDQDFPEGRHTEHTIREKDRWVENSVKSIIETRIAIETNKTARKLGVDEFGTKGKNTAIHFYRNQDCQLAYERYFCWVRVVFTFPFQCYCSNRKVTNL